MEQRAWCAECDEEGCAEPKPPPRQRPVLRLVSSVSRDSVQCASEAMTRADTGQVIGMIYAQIMPGGRYVIDFAGEARRNPTLARGLLLALDDELAKIA